MINDSLKYKYRLSHTWSLLPKKDKQSVDKYTELFSDKDNWAKLREHMDSLKIPCVPYIGKLLKIVHEVT